MIWLNSLTIHLLCIYDNLLTKCQKTPDVIQELCEKENTLQTEFYSIVYMVFKETYNFTVFTNFQDEGWTDILTWYCLSASIIKNSCEMNNIYFKKWFMEFVPSIRQLSYLNSEK